MDDLGLRTPVPRPTAPLLSTLQSMRQQAFLQAPPYCLKKHFQVCRSS